MRTYFYTDVNVSEVIRTRIKTRDVLDCLDDETLQEEVRNRGLRAKIENGAHILPVDHNKIQLKRLLCDITGQNYHVSNYELTKELRKRLP